MNINDLTDYDLIVIWGAGKGLKLYKKDFYCDYIVDKDLGKVGKKYAGIDIKSVEYLLEHVDKLRDDAKILIVISAIHFFDSIVKECMKLSKKVEYIDINDLLAMYRCERTSYALWGIDVLVRDIITRANMKVNEMQYIEIGACDPIHGNKSFNLYLNGASGTLVEPNPDYYDVIKRIRHDQVIQKGISNRRGLLKYYRFENKFRNTFDESAKNCYIEQGFRYEGEEDMECYTLEDLFDEANVITSKTILFVQVMGNEIDVLNNVKLIMYGFPLVVIGYRNSLILSNNCFDGYYQIAKIPGHAVFANEFIYKNIVGNDNE